MEFTRTSDPATSVDLEALRSYARGVPKEYLEWLALHDGQVADGTDLGFWGFRVEGADPVGPWQVNRIETVISSSTSMGFEGEDKAGEDGVRWPQPMLCIADDGGGNKFLLSLREDTWHEIWYWDHGNETADFDQPWWGNMHKVVDSFQELVDGGEWIEF